MERKEIMWAVVGYKFPRPYVYMEGKEIMWAVVGYKFPRPYVYSDTISYTKRGAIKKHVDQMSNLGMRWPEIKKKYDHRAQKVEITYKVIM